MQRIGMGLVGPGVAGAYHIDAVRRLGFVDVVAVASSTLERAKKKAVEYGISKAYGSYEELIADPDVHVVHNTTPNYLHAPVNMAAIERRKHIVSDKPLAMNSREARKMWQGAQEAGIVHAVTFNYRGNSLVQEARKKIAHGDLGSIFFVHGAYLQDWLFEDSFYSWHLDPAKNGPTLALGGIGCHWCDLVQHVTGLRIDAVLADLTTIVKTRRRPAQFTEPFTGSAQVRATEEFESNGEDLASALLRFENGAKGCFSVGQVCAGHKNDLWFEVNGSSHSLRWYQEVQNELWIGHHREANALLSRDSSMVPSSRNRAQLPAGHQEGWADAFRNIMGDIYSLILEGKDTGNAVPPLVATFEDGYRANCVVDALLESHASGGVWKKVEL